MELSIKDLKNKKFHFIGIGGISMSALAFMLINEKIYVQGSDESENDEVKKLKKSGITVFNIHNKENLNGVDVVVYSSAIADDNEELEYARANNLLILKRAELLAIIADSYKTVISIAGSHGKTTTTAMISEMFMMAGLKPTIHLGGVLESINSNYKIGNKDYFITESCEYKDNFLYIKPDLSVILNIDADHLDYFGDIKGVKKSFFKYSKNLRNGGVCIVCAGDKNCENIIKSANSVSFGLKNALISAKNIKEYDLQLYSFDVMFNGLLLGNIKLNIFGKHNIYNALAAILVGLLCDINFSDIKKSIENFSGTKRRTEYLGKIYGAKFFHDYAHHPTQIKAMLEIGKSLAKNSIGKLYAIYEPHTYSRTKFLIDEFIDAFENADQVLFAPVYAAREDKSQGFSSEKLCDLINKKYNKCKIFNNYDEIKNEILNNIKQGDVVFVLGAGSIEKLAKMIKNDINFNKN